MSHRPPLSLQQNGFKRPDFAAPIDSALRLAAIPTSASMKGLFFKDLLDEARSRQIDLPRRARYVSFSDYPTAEWVALLTEAAPRFFPALPLGEAVRVLGQRTYPAFANTLAGRVLFSTAGNEFGALLRLAGKAWQLAAPGSSACVAHQTLGSAVLELRNCWSYPESYVGIFEGAFTAFGVTGDVLLRVHSPCDLDLKLDWQP